MVSPIRIGGGTNFKLIEAAACGTPILAHSSRVSSLGLIPDAHLLSATTPSEFRAQLERLLENDPLQRKLSANAREFIEQNYSWQSIGKKLSKVWEEIAEKQYD